MGVTLGYPFITRSTCADRGTRTEHPSLCGRSNTPPPDYEDGLAANGQVHQVACFLEAWNTVNVPAIRSIEPHSIEYGVHTHTGNATTLMHRDSHDAVKML